jgi:hypothetical protein
MKKYGIAKRGFGRALRQNFGLGGMVIKKISKEAAKDNIEKAKKLTGKSKEKYQTEQEIIEKNKGKPFADMKKSEIAEELNAIKSQQKILKAKDVKVWRHSSRVF